MRRRVERRVIRWAVRRFAARWSADPDVSYQDLALYGVEDVSVIPAAGESASILAVYVRGEKAR